GLAVAYFLCGWALTRTISRGGTIAYTASVLAVLWFWRRQMAIAVAVAAAFIFVFFPSLVPGSIIGRFRSTWKKPPTAYTIADPQNLDESAADRIRIWQRSLSLIQQNPFFGIGYNNYQRLLGMDAHNFYILLATEMGIPAVVFFLYIIFRLARAAAYLRRHSADWRLQWLAHGCLASIVGVLVANLFGSRMNSQELTSLFWILAGLVMNAARRLHEGDPEFAAPPPPFGESADRPCESRTTNFEKGLANC
ncbi:MAG: O-antigen ligase family protein, partial [Planctomycetota bacterium]|nr:O-antigen ligase family protein [Planctomycetota bacterium]